ncbi:complement C1q subcomponent subunit A-like [Ptychodera flava]|uniref:complement C1q subcomponent subunit A-like n=1 Tax=Ptychodera flava TaxID=63121 RepID=UPI003969F79A
MKMYIAVVFILTGSASVWSLSPPGGSPTSEPCVDCCGKQNDMPLIGILRGEKGDAGAPGENGTMGSQGPMGPPGRNGAKGDKGDSGIMGIPGSRGEAGLPGMTGSKGELGIRGMKGHKGAPGVKGEKGEPYTYYEWSAFSVARSSAIFGGSEYKTVTYDVTILNVGDDLNESTGVFTCQIAGVYFFMFTTLKDKNKNVAAFIMFNDATSGRLFSDAGNWEGLISQSVHLNLSVGDRVWVRVDKHSEYQNVVLDSSIKRHTIFNGHLVFPTA